MRYTQNRPIILRTTHLGTRVGFRVLGTRVGFRVWSLGFKVSAPADKKLGHGPRTPAQDLGGVYGLLFTHPMSILELLAPTALLDGSDDGGFSLRSYSSGMGTGVSGAWVILPKR